MSNQYRLVYAAEVVEGQHAAVVKKRLQALLKLDDERMGVLFSGKSVVVKKAADKKTALRYADAFKKAGARLRILPVSVEGEPLDAVASLTAESAVPTAPPDTSTPANAADGRPDSASMLAMLPAGSDILAPEERSDVEANEVDTSHLGVQRAVFATEAAEALVDTPNIDHLSLADVGTPLGVAQAESEVILLELEVDFDLADVGALLADEQDPPTAAVDVQAIDFEVADSGAQLDTAGKPPTPSAPDTSHIELE